MRMPSDTSARIRDLLAEHPVVDGHNDLAWEARERVGYDWDRLDLSRAPAAPPTPTSRGCARAAWVPSSGRCSCPATLQGDAAVTATLEQVDAVHAMTARYAGRPRPRDHPRRRRAGLVAGPDRLADGRRGRPQHRLLARHAADAARARRALPDPHPQRQRAVGRLGDRRTGARRALAVRARGGAGDEPARDARRPLARVGRHHARRARRRRGTGAVLALLGPGGVRPPAQRARRRARPARRQRRGLHGHLRAEVRLPRGARVGPRRPGMPPSSPGSTRTTTRPTTRSSTSAR